MEIWILDVFEINNTIQFIKRVRRGTAIDLTSFDTEIRHEKGFQVVRECQAWTDTTLNNHAYARFLQAPKQLNLF